MLSEAPSAEATRDECYRAVFRDAADAILILDEDRRIVEANPAAGALLGVDADALVGRSFDALLAGDLELVHAAWRELLAFGEAKREHRVSGAAGVRLV